MIENRNHKPVDISIDENRLYQINQELAKYVTLNYSHDLIAP